MVSRGVRVLGASLAAAALCAGLSACSSKHHSAAQSSTPTQSRATSEPSAGSASAPSSSAASGTSGRRGGGAPTSTPAGEGPSAAEGATPVAGAPCRITSSADVAVAFGGKVGTSTAGTSGIGNPICRFTLTKSNAGVPGTVSVTVNAKSTAKTFAQIKKSQPGAASVSGVGDSAFYVASTGTLQFIKGSQAAVLQATLRAAPGGPSPSANQVKADVTSLARSVAASM
jgi:hypothetical protein